MSKGALSADHFSANAAGTALDADDHIVYNTSNGELFYDADGNGTGAAIQFALVANHAALTAEDFQVV